MRVVQSSQAKAHLTQLLTEVENGATVIITRHGRPIARLTREPAGMQDELVQAKERIRAFRRSMPTLSRADILSARDDGRAS